MAACHRLTTLVHWAVLLLCLSVCVEDGTARLEVDSVEALLPAAEAFGYETTVEYVREAIVHVQGHEQDKAEVALRKAKSNAGFALSHLAEYKDKQEEALGLIDAIADVLAGVIPPPKVKPALPEEIESDSTEEQDAAGLPESLEALLPAADEFGYKPVAKHIRDAIDFLRARMQFQAVVSVRKAKSNVKFALEGRNPKVGNALIEDLGKILEALESESAIPSINIAAKTVAESGDELAPSGDSDLRSSDDDPSQDSSAPSDSPGAIILPEPTYVTDHGKSAVGTVNKLKGPLFPKEPVMDDVMQGSLGDCWFLATLRSIVGCSDPSLGSKFVREAMKLSPDGKRVLVRLFSPPVWNKDTGAYVKRPTWFSVDYSVMSWSIGKELLGFESLGDRKLPTLQKHAAKWPFFFEKAAAAFKTGGIVSTEGVVGYSTFSWKERVLRPDLKNIQATVGRLDGGHLSAAFQLLLGAGPEDLTGGDGFGAPTVPKGQKDPYRTEQLVVFEYLKAAMDAGAPVGAGTKSHLTGPLFKRMAMFDLHTGHLYSVVGVASEDDNGELDLTVVVSNPHGDRMHRRQLDLNFFCRIFQKFVIYRTEAYRKTERALDVKVAELREE